MKSKKDIVSRRQRPAKAPLSRGAIVGAALDILERDGLAGLSLRKVATALHTGPASLYVYLSNLAELHALMLDQALGEVNPAERPGAGWRERLKALLLECFRVLYGRDGLAQVAMTVVPSGPGSLRIWERMLGLLREGGVSDERAAWGVDLLMLYVTAQAAEKSNWRAGGQGPEHAEAALAAVSPAEYPRLHALRGMMLSGDGPERAEWGLDVLLDGISGHSRPAG